MNEEFEFNAGGSTAVIAASMKEKKAHTEGTSCQRTLINQVNTF